MEPRSKILVVDDLIIFRELESRFLANAGQVVTAASGREAMEVARRERPEVVLAAFALPDVDGDQLCKEIKADPQLARTPVIVVTGSDGGEGRARAIRAGADDVLSKPIERLSLIAAVSRFLRYPLARALARVELDVPVRMECDEGPFDGRSRNVSRGGIFVGTDRTLPLEAELSLEFRLPDDGDPIVATARVVWRRGEVSSAESADGGLGLQFLRLDPACGRRIESFVAVRAPRQKTPDPPVR